MINNFKFLIYLLIIFTGLIGCNKNNISADNFTYKGKPLHTQINLDILPGFASYDFNTKLPEDISGKLNATMKDLIINQNITGITVTLLMPNKGIWQIDTGYVSKNDNKKVNAESIFYWMSVGKMVTGILIGQLINEKKISLTDKLSVWYPQFQNSDKITIEHLLTHTSGIYSFNSDSVFNLSSKHYTYTEQLDIALSHKNLFNPGEYWSYSNTGYLLLGLIIEKLENKPFAQIVTDRISKPLDLKTIKALLPEEVPDNLALSHKNGEVVKDEEYGHGGAGNIAGNSKEILLIFHSLLTGTLFTKSLLQEDLKDLYPMFDKGTYYGKGIMLWDFNEINNKNDMWIGHAGGLENYNAIVLYDINTKIFISLSINQHLSAAAVANTLLKAIN